MARGRRRVDDYRDAVTKSADLPASAKLVALAMSNYMHFVTLHGAFPGPARISRETGMSTRSVKRWLAFLTHKGWLEKTSIGGSFPTRRATVYRGRIPSTSDRAVTGQEAATSDRTVTGQGSATSDRYDTGTSDRAVTPTPPKGGDRNRGGALRPTLDGSALAPPKKSGVINLQTLEIE